MRKNIIFIIVLLVCSTNIMAQQSYTNPNINVTTNNANKTSFRIGISPSFFIMKTKNVKWNGLLIGPAFIINTQIDDYFAISFGFSHQFSFVSSWLNRPSVEYIEDNFLNFGEDLHNYNYIYDCYTKLNRNDLFFNVKFFFQDYNTRYPNYYIGGEGILFVSTIKFDEIEIEYYDNDDQHQEKTIRDEKISSLLFTPLLIGGCEFPLGRTSVLDVGLKAGYGFGNSLIISLFANFKISDIVKK